MTFSASSPPKVANVRLFAPERWGMVARYANFYESTHELSRQARQALRGISAHFDKAEIFRSLAEDLRGGVTLDAEHLHTHGYTEFEHSRKLAAVIESEIQELYSAVDCTRQVVHCLFAKTCRRFPDSTRKTFQAVRDAKLTGLAPELEDAFANAHWYWQLLHMRDALTHSDTGMCRAAEGNTISYSHAGLSQNGKSLEISDIFQRLDSLATSVNQFIGEVFHYLYGQLRQEPMRQTCGIFEGRFYFRHVAPLPDLSFHSGVCGTRHYEASPGGRRCPLAEQCGAFARADPKDDATNLAR